MSKTLKNLPTFEIEKSLLKQGYKTLAGIDEVGIGNIAGPVVVGAIVFSLPSGQDPDFEGKLQDLTALLSVRDSKRLDKYHILEKTYNLFMSGNPFTAIGIVSIEELNEIKNVNKAALIATERALSELEKKTTPDFILLDSGLAFENLSTPHLSIKKGDEKSISISAASVLAKYTLDTYMIEQSKIHSNYDFENNKGYITKAHLEALNQCGPSPVHRTYHKTVKKYFKIKN